MSNSSQSVATRPGKRSAENGDRPKGTKVVDKSTRVSHACELCREKRARCNGERPTCQRCVKLGVECQYGLAKNDRRRKEIEDLQRRVTEYEGLLESLTPKLDVDSREKFLALQHDAVRAESPTRSENDESSAPYTTSGPSSLQSMSAPPQVHGGESGSSMSGSTAISHSVRPFQLRQTSGVSPFQPFSSSDQASPRQRNPSSALSQDSVPSLTSSVVEWHKGFIYTATEAIVPPRDVTERAVKAFLIGSTMLFDFFEKDEIDEIFHSVYESRPSPGRTIALCQLCITAAVGCQYDWDQFPDDTAKSYLAVAKLYVEEIIETHALSAMRVMALLAMYFSFEKRMSSLVYIDSGLAIARAQQVDTMTPTRETRRWKRTWCSLIFLGSWIASTVGRSLDPANHFHPSMLNWGNTMSMADTIQLEMCKVAHLTGRILRDVYHAPSVDTGVVNMYKAELESWLFGLPGFMRIDSLLANGSNEIPMRPIFLLHLLYLSTMGLIYRRILSEFAESPESLISNTAMEDVKHHLDACLWSSRQVSRILNVAMLNGHATRKCWMFIHGAYCANNILLYFAANKLLQNPGSDGVAEDIMASEQCIRTLEHCAAADDTASHFLKHVKPLHIALSQMHMVSRTTAPRDVVPIANLISEYLDAPRANIPVGDDLPQMQRTIVSVIQTLLQSPVERTRFQPRPPNGVVRRESGSASRSMYPDPQTGMSVSVSGFRWGDGTHSAADSLRNYFFDDSLGQLAFKNGY